MSHDAASYYDRQPTTHLDGSPIFKTGQDETNEATTAHQAATAWGCEFHSFGRLSPIDWYATRDDRIVGVIELKSRSHQVDRFPTVYLNVRKWLALQLAAAGLGVPAIFIVQWTDETRWIPIASVDAASTKMGGCLRIVKSRSDVEPVIEVPTSQMRRL